MIFLIDRRGPAAWYFFGFKELGCLKMTRFLHQGDPTLVYAEIFRPIRKTLYFNARGRYTLSKPHMI